MDIERKIQEMGLVLPPAPPPGGVYRPITISGKMLYVSGHGPVRADGTLIAGVVGADLSMEDGYAAARQVGLTMLSTLREQLDSLNSIKRIMKVLGMVNSAPDFRDHPKVINGFSELMMEIWGEDNGLGARSAVGMILPGHIAVEVEAIFELK
jgi:enamine deaminase RidA (YjgF/YER057c/UK114 family)